MTTWLAPIVMNTRLSCFTSSAILSNIQRSRNWLEARAISENLVDIFSAPGSNQSELGDSALALGPATSLTAEPPCPHPTVQSSLGQVARSIA